ncbi:1,3-beta-D-glucan synthase catalytic subunit [Zopfochytrium polystomum]|nr:1,3-beta-D-glucan synthase catalytic subunit [Zopfochytrium polystomum]
MFLPLTAKKVKIVLLRLGVLFLLLLVNVGPIGYILLVSKKGTIAQVCSGIQIAVSVLTVVTLAIIPPGRLCVSEGRRRRGFSLTNTVFSSNFAPLKSSEQWMSICIWVVVFISKAFESFFFIVTPAGKPILIFATLPVFQCGKAMILCRVTTLSGSFFLLLTTVVLFFLDTYMWWIGRIYAKLLASRQMTARPRPKALCAQVWNAVVINMAQEHLISVNSLDKLLYCYHPDGNQPNHVRIEAPKFFTSQEDVSTKMESFPANSEAYRRVSFFAQSLSMVFPEPTSVQRMPSFSVLVPHYGEKILLSLKEIIRQSDPNSSITLLDFGEPHEIALNAVGFFENTSISTLRTRIWASLRSQTLFRCVSGFMNYQKALKLLARVENPELVSRFQGDELALEVELDRIASSKFAFVVAMQRYHKFDAEELENANLLLRFFPSLKISYIEEDEAHRFFACLTDSECEILENGRRRPKFRIQLPGYPVLGDGKSDNQNASLIFARGEFLQLVDANQDHYFEECLKIRSILQEFLPNSSAPVSIVGAREFIFSERIGVLGDVAAGKEYCFGTIAQRVTAKLGARLHYGHPDFLNTVFMTTRGGMNALMRGGRITHTEYMQCGKGRDLGFSSILKFVAKIGAGMGEQMLSREQYYLGTQLPLDRLLTFFYGHPGFHLNNIFIMLSLQLMLLTLLCTAVVRTAFTPCTKVTISSESIVKLPAGCVEVDSLVDWVKQAVFSIVAVFAINFLPLFAQILAEQGFIPAVSRIAKHVASFSPLFDVFTTQIYSHTLLNDFSFGRAGYISSGRSVATSRGNFHTLFQAFAEPSIYFGKVFQRIRVANRSVSKDFGLSCFSLSALI